MKLRTGYVSNSSSSSFVLSKRVMSDEDVIQLLNLSDEPMGPYRDTWHISDEGTEINGYTYMNNNQGDAGGLEDYFKKNGLACYVIWEHD